MLFRSKGKRNHARHLREAATGRVAAWLGRIDCTASPPETKTPPFSSPDVSLQDLPSPTDLDPHPLLRSPAVLVPEKSGTGKNEESPTKHDSIPTRSSGFVLHAARDASSTFSPPPEKQSEITVSPRDGVTSSPETPTMTSPGPSPLKPVLRRLMESPDKGHPVGNKYDVRSARGGRGGKVTSVAALWASLASQQQQENGLSPVTRQPEKAAGAFTPTLKNAQQKTTPEKDKNKERERERGGDKLPDRAPPHAKKRQEYAANANGMNVAELTARRARMVKATSVPAVVSSSLATPVLSSTASLARPIQAAAPYPKRTYPPAHTSFSPSSLVQSPPTLFAELSAPSPQAESSPPRTKTAIASSSTSPPKSPPAVSNELAFGQARLKDLIRKYSQGFGQ